jgi:hypothetical protein
MILPVLDGEKDYQKLAPLARALGGLAAWLDPGEAQRASTRIMRAIQAQEYPFFIKDLLIGLSSVASRLRAEQVDSLMEELIAELMKSAGKPASGFKAMELPWCLKDLASLLGPEQVQIRSRRVVEAMLREKDAVRLDAWCTVAGAMADRLDAGQWSKISERLVEAMEQDQEGNSLSGLGWQLERLKGWIETPFLQRAAVRLIEAAPLEKNRDRLRSRAETLAKLVDRLKAEEAQRAAETTVGIFLEIAGQDEILPRIANWRPWEASLRNP